MKFLAAVLSGLVVASLAQARVPGFGEYRPVQESLGRVHPRMRAMAMLTDCGGMLSLRQS
ncbi:MAG TPA: hypothetical protein VMH22_03790 [bacterium]|nr:hypothetical protein [bacterium]